MSIYEHYSEWKTWKNWFQYDSALALKFKTEFNFFSFQDKNILEIGFGEGSFLAWARDQATAKTFGAEILEEALKKAVAEGFDIIEGDLGDHSELEGYFDLIVAMDVFEHLGSDILRELLESIHYCLKPGGKLYMKVPNASSPFGLVHHSGDITHVQMLSAGSMQQLCYDLNLKMVEQRDEKEVWPKGFRMIEHGFRYGIKCCIEFLIRKAYRIKVPLGKNLVVVFEKTT